MDRDDFEVILSTRPNDQFWEAPPMPKSEIDKIEAGLLMGEIDEGTIVNVF
jgi:hypothetical protein